MPVNESRRSVSVRRALLIAAVLQLLLLLLSTMTMDDGEMFTAFAYGAVAYWTAAGLVLRRRSRLSRVDLMFLRFGLPLVSIFSLAFAPLVWTLRGAW